MDEQGFALPLYSFKYAFGARFLRSSNSGKKQRKKCLLLPLEMLIEESWAKR